MTDWEEVRALEPLHILQESVVRERFDYDDAPGVHVAFVRVFRLEPVWRFPDSKGVRRLPQLGATARAAGGIATSSGARQMSAPIEGGCLCGGVRYRLHAEPIELSDCHCIDCRRASGAPFVTWGTVRQEDIELLSGELRKVHHAGRLRSFAACCGTPLFFPGRRSIGVDRRDDRVARSAGKLFSGGRDLDGGSSPLGRAGSCAQDVPAGSGT